jgi:4-alpha-glucanotransferase
VDDEQHGGLHRGRRSLLEHLRVTFGVRDDDQGLRAIHDNLLSEMSASDAWAVLVTLEDLWLERRPQNIPGTGAEYGNWTRKLSRSLGELVADPALRTRLRRLFENRRPG